MAVRKISQVLSDIEENKKNLEVIPTGLIQLDMDLEGGFFKKELIIIGGKTGGGKSLMAGTLFYNIAKQGFKSAYFSLEISSEMIVSRLLGANANLSPSRIMIKELEGNDADTRDDAQAKVSVYEEFMYFYDDMYQYADIEKEIKNNNYDFIIIDFIQNILYRGEEYERLSSIALALQRLAKSSNTCIVAVSQLSNQMTRDTDKKTDLLEYKGSGAIGHAADLGFFIEGGRAGEGSFSMRLRKNRRGISGVSYSYMIKSPGGAVVEL